MFWLARAARVSRAAILERACLLVCLVGWGEVSLVYGAISIASARACWDDAVMAQRREQRLSCRLRCAAHAGESRRRRRSL